MKLTEAQAKTVVRLCRIVSFGLLAGAFLLHYSIKSSGDSSILPQLSGFTKSNFKVENIEYKSLNQLISSVQEPFSFADNQFSVRSFMVVEEIIEPQPYQAGPDLSGLSLFGIIENENGRKAVLQDSSSPTIVMLQKGDLIRGCLVLDITEDSMMLQADEKRIQFTWDRKWQKLSGSN